MRRLIALFPVLASMAFACGTAMVESEDETAALGNESPLAAPAPALDNDPPAIAVQQILDAATLATYKAALPKVGYARLQKILESPSTLFWDKQVMPPTYQDTVGGQNLPIGARRNNAGKGLIVEPGKKLFSADGDTWAFPFGHTAGTDESQNIVIVNFMSLPAANGKLLPVAYKLTDRDTGDGLRLIRWDWVFPKGTTVGEILLVRDPQGALLTTEIRVRERFTDKWATNVFRPFPTAQSLTAAIKALRPGYASQPSVKAVVDSLENSATLTPKTLSSPAFNNLVSLQGAEDAPLPDFADDALVRELLTKTPFVSSYGEVWKQNGTQRAFGAHAGTARFSVFPDRSATGLLEVRESTCEKCHNEGGTFIGDLVPDAILYGDVWGNDRIFSFHPFEPSRIQGAGDENRVVRPAFAQSGIVERYDLARHPAALYQMYTPRRSR